MRGVRRHWFAWIGGLAIVCVTSPAMASRETCGDLVCEAEEECEALERDPAVYECVPKGTIGAAKLVCSSDEKAVHCVLPVPGKLESEAMAEAKILTVDNQPIAPLRIDTDGRGLSALHGSTAGTVVRVHVPVATTYRDSNASAKGTRIRGLADGRRLGSIRFETVVRVPGGTALSPVELTLPDRLGPVALGMRREELKALGLPFQSDTGDEVKVGPLRVQLRDQKVVSIAFALTESFRPLLVQKVSVGANSTAEYVASVVGGSCGPLEIRRGGALYRCHGGRVLIKRIGPTRPASVEVELTTPAK